MWAKLRWNNEQWIDETPPELDPDSHYARLMSELMAARPSSNLYYAKSCFVAEVNNVTVIQKTGYWCSSNTVSMTKTALFESVF